MVRTAHPTGFIRNRSQELSQRLVARASFLPTTSGLTMFHPFSQPSDRRLGEHPRVRRPVPPVDHGPDLEIRPEAVFPFEKQHAVPGDFEAQQGRRFAEEDQVDLALRGPAELGSDVKADVPRVWIKEDAEIDVASRSSLSPGG